MTRSAPRMLALEHSADRAPRHSVQRRSEEHTSELQSPCNLVCRLLLETKKRAIRGHETFDFTGLRRCCAAKTASLLPRLHRALFPWVLPRTNSQRTGELLYVRFALHLIIWLQ